ncbi:MAG: Sfum_1244 family protein, partial [Pseudomonadota bacterium]
AQLERHEQRQGIRLFVSGCEYARDISAPPASLLDGMVFLRGDALRRWLWEKVEIWGVRKADGALKSALECHGFAADAEAALERMAEAESETLILHELGEAMAGPLLGAAWPDLIASFTGRRAEALARALRDNLADCLSTLPRLIERDAACSIHFYFANFDGLRGSLFPSLDQAYRRWRESGDLEPLREAALAGSAHWRDAALRLLRVHQGDPATAEDAIAAWSEDPGALAL